MNGHQYKSKAQDTVAKASNHCILLRGKRAAGHRHGWLLAAGVAVGLVGAFGIRRAMETQLFGVQAMDPTVIALVTGVIGVVAFLACAVPARRAARIDPLVALANQ